MGRKLLRLTVAAATLGLAGCRGCGEPAERPDAGRQAPADATAGDAAALAPAPDGAALPPPRVHPEPRCPPDMVRVARRFCVDRYEATLVDKDSGQHISPHYPPSRKMALYVERVWQQQRLEVGSVAARAIPLPPLPAWERQRDFEPKARSRQGVVPNGHVTGELALLACRNAGKRLCSLQEWKTACQGQQERKFPYGEQYEQGRCNVFRYEHPAAALHDDASRGHTDPRLGLVKDHSGRPLLRETGATTGCKSEWEDDAVYDLVGNLDEWIDDPDGTFVGSFYSRATKDGCEWRATGHTFAYGDYSTTQARR
ncbi:MAG: hypothetical protein HY744_21515 [Deltaproteobacteria bacterium]|nr:hypothetical protein [Deltaproteobacteria bacterium]